MPIIYDQNGQVLFNSDNPGVVKISNDDNNPIPADILDRAERELGVVSADNLDIALSDLQNAIAGAGAAAKTLADLATLLTSLIAKDFATEAKLEAVRALLAGTINTQLSGSNAEVVSAQDAQVSTIAQTYIRAVDATQIEVYVESGYVRVRTDGEAATPTTGEPFGPGYGGAWTVNSISVYYVADSTITVVSR